METLNSTRFGMFAVAHILWSVVCSLTLGRLMGIDYDGELEVFVITAGMMLAYLPLGWAAARFGLWAKPTTKQSRRAVLLPTGIAWLWAGTTAVCLYSGGDELIGLGAALGLPAFLLAVPSLLFVCVFMTISSFPGWAGSLDFRVWISVAIFFAGLLPPLLFWLGSIMGVKKETELKNPETA